MNYFHFSHFLSSSVKQFQVKSLLEIILTPTQDYVFVSSVQVYDKITLEIIDAILKSSQFERY